MDEMKRMNVAAIIPAAGHSRRFGGIKQLADAGDGKPMLRGVLDAIRGAGVTDVLLVLNGSLRPHLSEFVADARVVFNDDPLAEMIDSVRLGLRTWEELRKTMIGGFLVCPCDAAGLAPADVRRCLEAFDADRSRICVGARNGKRGHPIVFPASMAEFVLSGSCDAGLNRLARENPERVVLVECDSPGVTANVNTPEDVGR